jgi:hypothetical protein
MTGPDEQSGPLHENGPGIPADDQSTPASAPDAGGASNRGPLHRSRRRSGQLLVKISPAAMRRLKQEAGQNGGRPEILASQLLDRKFTQEADMADRRAFPPERALAERARAALPRASQSYLIVTKRPLRLADVLDWVQAQGAVGRIASDLEDALNQIRANRWTCAVFEVDSLGDLKDVVDAIVELRDQRPNLPVILVSRHVQRDDFDHFRLPLCDVTLRFPVDAANFSFAVDEALVNNRVWIARRRMRHLSSAEEY